MRGRNSLTFANCVVLAAAGVLHSYLENDTARRLPCMLLLIRGVNRTIFPLPVLSTTTPGIHTVRPALIHRHAILGAGGRDSANISAAHISDNKKKKIPTRATALTCSINKLLGAMYLGFGIEKIISSDYRRRSACVRVLVHWFAGVLTCRRRPCKRLPSSWRT